MFNEYNYLNGFDILLRLNNEGHCASEIVNIPMDITTPWNRDLNHSISDLSFYLLDIMYIQ